MACMYKAARVTVNAKKPTLLTFVIAPHRRYINDKTFPYMRMT